MGAVLIVDDEQPVRRLLERWLVGAGHPVVAAGGAREALECLDGGGVAVAVVDLHMEGPDGFWLAQQIRTCHPDTAVAVRLAAALKVSPDDLESIERAALLHDIGKIGVGRAVLAQERPLTDDERAMVRQHVELGHAALEVGFLADVARVLRASHEAWDGSGYPDGLRGESIPRAARIIAVADAWDALTHDRVSRRSIGKAAARAELARCAGTQFDPDVVDALASLEVSRSSLRSAA